VDIDGKNEKPGDRLNIEGVVMKVKMSENEYCTILFRN
jgi:hypothetical protein